MGIYDSTKGNDCANFSLHLPILDIIILSNLGCLINKISFFLFKLELNISNGDSFICLQVVVLFKNNL